MYRRIRHFKKIQGGARRGPKRRNKCFSTILAVIFVLVPNPNPNQNSNTTA